MREGMFIGRLPVGYRNVRDEYGFGAIEADPEKAALVRRMYAMREEGRSGRPLSVAGVHWILNCPTYKGLARTPEGELVRGMHEAIID